jgi:ribonuclease HI
MYSKNCLTTWLPSWTRNKWKTSQGGDVQHRDLIEDTANRLSRFKSFNIQYVKAHTGGADEQSKCNHIVDRMATKVLCPEDALPKEITSNTQDPFENCPLKLMGPPVSEKELVEWCLSNLNKLDQSSLATALCTVFSKSVKSKGFEVTKQKLHRSTLYRLKTDSGLIKEGITVVKEE